MPLIGPAVGEFVDKCRCVSHYLPMKPWFFAAAGSLTVAACAHPVERRLEGRWIGDTITNVEAAALPAAIGWVRGTSFEFSGSNVTVSIPTELPRTGEYEVARGDKQAALLAVRRADGSVDQMQIGFDGDGTLRWHAGHGRDIVLRRLD